MRRYERALFFVLAVACVGLSTKAGWIEAKAWLAQVLIAQAWQQTLAEGAVRRPWPWADTWPVAALETPQGQRLYVLESASGEALAFGPGRIPAGGAMDAGLMIAGHRDTHFRFLKTLRTGEALRVQRVDGQWREFSVDAMRVVDSRREALLPVNNASQLVLVSCYPFDAARAGGPLRYVVSARQYTGGAEDAI
jgi:sortase A